MQAAPQPLTEPELRQVLEPDFNSSTFVFGKNPDGSPRTWKLVPLPWKFEKNFRRQVMPMLAVTYKPFETILAAMSQDFVSELTPSVLKTVFDAEIESDDFLVLAVHSILLHQDASITKEWVEDMALNREQLFSIVERQCDLHKIMDRLGESLAERFGKLAQMMGVEVDLPMLKQLWKQVSARLSERIMKAVSVVDSATGPFTDNSSETTFQSNPVSVSRVGDHSVS